MNTRQRQSSWPACQRAGATQRKNRHGGYGLQVLIAVLMMLVAGVTPAQAEDWYVEETLWDKEYNVKFTAQKYHYLADFTNPVFWTSDYFNMDNWHTTWYFYIKAYYYSVHHLALP